MILNKDTFYRTDNSDELSVMDLKYIWSALRVLDNHVLDNLDFWFFNLQFDCFYFYLLHLKPRF